MKRVFWLIMFILIPVSVEAKTLYVNGATGNDATSYSDNSEAAPWATIGRAAWGSTSRGSRNANEAARAGDTVLIQAGIYYAPGQNDRLEPALCPTNSGTPQNPITFKKNGTGTLEVRTSNGKRGPLIGSCGTIGADYIIWDGFYFNMGGGYALGLTDSGIISIWGSTGSQVLNCEVNGAPQYVGYSDNWDAIRIESSSNILVKNNKLHGMTDPYGPNPSGIKVYYSTGCIIEHNEVYNCNTGIFPKGGSPQSNNIVRYNYVYNCDSCITVSFTYDTSTTTKVYQNILIPNGNGTGISLGEGINHVRVANNIMYGGYAGAGVRGAGSYANDLIIQNNIVVGVTEGINAGEDPSVYFGADYNDYYSVTRWTVNETIYSSIASWRTRLGACPGGGNECGSTTSNPLFANASNRDFHLQSGSPCINAGVDILDLNKNGSTIDSVSMGAYVTGNEIIGIESCAENAPEPPCCLRIVN